MGLSDEFKPNSRKYRDSQKNDKPEPKSIEKVVTGKVTVKKKSEARKFADVFVSEDFRNVASHILADILIPAVKDIISNAITDGVNMMLYGEANRTRKTSNISRTPYNSLYTSRLERSSIGNETEYRKPRINRDYDDAIFDSRADAELVLDSLDEIIQTYGQAKVSDLGELLGVTGPYTDNNYGWTDLHSAKIVRLNGGGYILNLPRAIALER